jgi:hypothetical protein
VAPAGQRRQGLRGGQRDYPVPPGRLSVLDAAESQGDSLAGPLEKPPALALALAEAPRGTIAFAIPAFTKPSVLFFTTTFKTKYGQDESLVLVLEKT